MKFTTLEEYRQQYPRTAKYPTITQSGVLGLILERQRVKAARAAARREARRRFFETIAHPLQALQHAFDGRLAGHRPARLRPA